MRFGWKFEIKIPKTGCVLLGVLNGLYLEDPKGILILSPKGIFKGIKGLRMEGFA